MQSIFFSVTKLFNGYISVTKLSNGGLSFYSHMGEILQDRYSLYVARQQNFNQYRLCFPLLFHRMLTIILQKSDLPLHIVLKSFLFTLNMSV